MGDFEALAPARVESPVKYHYCILTSGFNLSKHDSIKKILTSVKSLGAKKRD